MSLKVSVIVPCFNQASYLGETLESVYKQTHQDWECIIVDDGSTDNSKEIAAIWCKKDKRFLYKYKENGGLSSARNFGLKMACGEYVQLLDSDDLIKPKKFSEQLKDLLDSEISVSDYLSFIDGTNNEAPHRYLSPFLSEEDYKKQVILDWEYRKSIPCHAVLFKRSLILENELSFNEALPNHEDWVFWTQLFYYSKSIKNNKNILALYRIRKHSMSVDFKLMKQGFLQAAKILQRFFKQEKDTEFNELAKEKYHEVYQRGRVPFIKRIKSKIYSKLAYCYRYVRKN